MSHEASVTYVTTCLFLCCVVFGFGIACDVNNADVLLDYGTHVGDNVVTYGNTTCDVINLTQQFRFFGEVYQQLQVNSTTCSNGNITRPRKSIRFYDYQVISEHSPQVCTDGVITLGGDDGWVASSEAFARGLVAAPPAIVPFFSDVITAPDSGSVYYRYLIKTFLSSK